MSKEYKELVERTTEILKHHGWCGLVDSVVEEILSDPNILIKADDQGEFNPYYTPEGVRIFNETVVVLKNHSWVKTADKEE